MIVVQQIYGDKIQTWL